MNVINYELFHCPTVSTFICVKINVLRNFTRQNISYFWALIFNCYGFQGHVIGISQTLILLFVIKKHPIFRHSLIHLWNFLRTKNQIITFPIQLV